MTLSFSMVSGDSKQLNISAVDRCGAIIKLDGVIDITWSLFQSISGVEVLTKNLSTGVSIVDASIGLFKVDINPVDTISFSGQYKHEHQITFSSGIVLTPKENLKKDDGVAVIKRGLIT